jgi:hypothetical protein
MMNYIYSTDEGEIDGNPVSSVLYCDEAYGFRKVEIVQEEIDEYWCPPERKRPFGARMDTIPEKYLNVGAEKVNEAVRAYIKTLRSYQYC